MITLDIHVLGITFLLTTACDLPYKPSSMGFNIPTNLFQNFAEIGVRNGFNKSTKTLEVPFSIRSNVTFSKLLQMVLQGLLSDNGIGKI